VDCKFFNNLSFFDIFLSSRKIRVMVLVSRTHHKIVYFVAFQCVSMLLGLLVLKCQYYYMLSICHLMACHRSFQIERESLLHLKMVAKVP
jgi:hypothetical protein